MTYRSDPARKSIGGRARYSRGTSGGMKNTPWVTPPSTCFSVSARPSTSTGISTGEKNAGIAADASSTLATKSRAAGVPGWAIAPTSHTTGRRPSRSVVPTYSRRPGPVFGGDPVEGLEGQHPVDLPGQRRVVGQRVRQQPPDGAPLRVHVCGFERGVHPAQLAVVVRPQERQRRRQRPGADPGHTVEARPGAGLRPADQHTRLVRPERPAAGQGQDGLFGGQLLRQPVGPEFLAGPVQVTVQRQRRPVAVPVRVGQLGRRQPDARRRRPGHRRPAPGRHGEQHDGQAPGGVGHGAPDKVCG